MEYQQRDPGRSSLYERVKKLLVSFHWSDCSFSLSGKHLKAHKLILGISSPVFEAMFYGPLANDDDVTITDIQPEIFQLLLNYIYTDKVELASIDDAFELLYASKKYMLEPLGELCTAYIQTNMSIDNVTTILNYPEFMQSGQLFSSALKLFCEHANYLLPQSKHMITLSCMRHILGCDQINIMERDLIKAVFDWTSFYCEQNNIPNNLLNKRDVLIKNNMFDMLRLHTLPESHLEEILADKNNLLIDSEVNFIKEVSKNLGIAASPRDCLKIKWHLCMRSPLKSVQPIVINSSNFVVHTRLKASKSLFISAFWVPTRMAPLHSFRSTTPGDVYSDQINVSIACESDNTLVKETYILNTVPYDSMVDIKLIEPYLMKKDKWYKVSFEWPELNWAFNSYSYVVECRDKFYSDHRVEFEFEDMLVTGHNRSFLGGLKYSL